MEKNGFGKRIDKSFQTFWIRPKNLHLLDAILSTGPSIARLKSTRRIGIDKISCKICISRMAFLQILFPFFPFFMSASIYAVLLTYIICLCPRPTKSTGRHTNVTALWGSHWGEGGMDSVHSRPALPSTTLPFRLPTSIVFCYTHSADEDTHRGFYCHGSWQMTKKKTNKEIILRVRLKNR